LSQATQELIREARRCNHHDELQEDIKEQSFSLMDGRMHACQLPGAAGVRPRLSPRKARERVDLV
jgi:hypothetical protein